MGSLYTYLYCFPEAAILKGKLIISDSRLSYRTSLLELRRESKQETFKRKLTWLSPWVTLMNRRRTTRRASSSIRDSSSVLESLKTQSEPLSDWTDSESCITSWRTIVSLTISPYQLHTEKSLQFHQKHLQFTDNENVFASYYNLGISHRLIRDFDESVKYFKQALEWAQSHQEIESECISNG